jgi:hypothetical protein
MFPFIQHDCVKISALRSGQVLAPFNNPGTRSLPSSPEGTNEPPTPPQMVDSTLPRVRNLPTDNFPRLESTGNNRAPWSIAFQSVCRSQGFDTIFTTDTNPTTSEEIDADRNVHHLLVSTIDHSLAVEVLKLATSHQAWSFLQQVGLTTSTYGIIPANKAPTLHDSTSTKAFLQAHRSMRNAILNRSPDDPLATPRHSIHLFLAGLPEHDSEPSCYKNV